MLTKDGAPMLAAQYLRKSRAEELSPDYDVLARHRAALRELAVRLDITIIGTYEEIVSGESLSARHEMRRLLEAVENDEYDAVLCMDIDRLGRGNMRDQGEILDAFRRSETLIITPDKAYDLSDESDEELTEFKTFLARREYKLITKRMRRGLMKTVSEGGYIANAPYGYVKTMVDKKPSLAINEDEARFVRYIFARYLEGVGATTIADELNAMGAKTHRVGKWGPSSVRHILRNPTFTGKVVWNRCAHIKKGTQGSDRHLRKYQPKEKWIIAEGLHQAIIDEKTFELAQKIRVGRYIPSQNTGEVKNPLAGIVKCARCGRNMQKMNMSKNDPYVLCNTKGCSAGAKEEYVEQAILAALAEELSGLRRDMDEESGQDVSPIHEAIEQIGREITKNKDKLRRVFDFLEDGTYDKQTFESRRDLCLQDGAKLESRLEELRLQISAQAQADRREQAETLSNALEHYSAATAKGKNMLLKSIVSDVTYEKQKKTPPHDFQLTLTLKDF